MACMALWIYCNTQNQNIQKIGCDTLRANGSEINLET